MSTLKNVYANIHGTFICNKDYRFGRYPAVITMHEQQKKRKNYGIVTPWNMTQQWKKNTVYKHKLVGTQGNYGE